MLVAQGDEHYAHLHAMANSVHPITRIFHKQTFFYRDIQGRPRMAEREMSFRENTRTLLSAARTMYSRP